MVHLEECAFIFEKKLYNIFFYHISPSPNSSYSLNFMFIFTLSFKYKNLTKNKQRKTPNSKKHNPPPQNTKMKFKIN